MSDDAKFEKGDSVYRSFDPGRHGTITGTTRARAGDTYYQVAFGDGGMEYVPAYELRRDSQERRDPERLIASGEFGGLSDLRRNISHILLSGKLSNIIYSMDVTNSDFMPHQFKPVLAFLESPSHGLLIADEVGLGKTIEAGLIWTELRARYDYRRVLVVCPAMLCEKWQDELRDRFGIDAVIMRAEQLQNELRHAPENIQDGKGIICSIQSIRPPHDYEQDEGKIGARYELARYLDARADNPPIIDLLIIDEAHYLRNRETQSSRLGRMLRDVSENVLLLSATPINLSSEDLFSLLNIVDPDTFSVPDLFPQVLQANEPLVKARALVLDKSVSARKIRECLQNAAAYDLIQGSLQLKSLIDALSDPTSVDDIADRVRLADRIEQVNLLQHVVNRTKKSEVIEMRVHRNPVSHFVELKDIERKFYDAVTSAIRHYAKEHGINQGFLLANPQRQVSSCMYAAAKLWSEQGGIDLDLERNMLYETGLESDATTASATGASPLRTRLVSDVLPGVDLQQLWDNDSKFGTFITEIEKYFAAYPQEKIVVFSYFRATLRYLEERLDKIGIRGEVLMGGMQESKQKIINRFREDDSIRVLLSSEVASEGVDLQFCRVLVNYDLPWNPMRIEQRIGRLDRIGQKAEQIHIWNLCYADTIDQRIYERLFERLKIFERALGDMEAILGEQVAELTGFLMSQSLTPKQEEDRIAQTATAIENRRQTEEMLEKEAANLLAHGGYILERVKNAQKLKKKITEGDLIVYVRDYLDKYAPGHTFHQPGKDKHRVNIKLPPDAAAALEHYAGEKKLGHTRLVSGLEVPCEFINKTNVAAGRTEQISQFHPFVRFISGKIDENGFHPVVAIRLRRDASLAGANLPAGQYAFAVQKWSFGGLREEIDMRVRMMHMENGAESPSSEDAWELLNAARLSGADWPEVGANVHPDLSDRIFDCNDDLRRDFDRERERKETENKDRVNLQIRSTEKHRDRQLASLNRVLENHRNRGQLQMIPATEGRIKSIKSRFEVQIEKLNLKEGLTPGRREVCCGVLFLES